MRNCSCACDTYFNVEAQEEQYVLSDFTFEDLRITANNDNFTEGIVENMTVKNVQVDIRPESDGDTFGQAVFGS